MVVLVRCSDETFSVALESCLDGLIKGGLITAYLDEGEWVPVTREQRNIKLYSCRRQPAEGLMAAVA